MNYDLIRCSFSKCYPFRYAVGLFKSAPSPTPTFTRQGNCFSGVCCALLYSYANILTVMLINRLHSAYTTVFTAWPAICLLCPLLNEAF